MGFFIFVAMILIIWLLWTLCRNTGDALDKQTALQYEIVALEKRIEQLVERLPPAASGSADSAVAPTRPVSSASPATNSAGKAKSASKRPSKKTTGTSPAAKPAAPAMTKSDNDSAGSARNEDGEASKNNGPTSGA